MAKLNNLDQTIRVARTRAGDRSGVRTMAAILAILFLCLLALFIQQLITPVPVGAAPRPTARVIRLAAPTVVPCTANPQTVMEGVIRVTCPDGTTVLRRPNIPPRTQQRATATSTPVIHYGP